MPPKDSTIMCNRKSDWGTLEAEVIKFSNKGYLMICGDMNAWTGTLCDYVISDDVNSDYLPPTYMPDQDHPRTSKDQSANAQGRCLLELCKGSRIRIMNGRHKNDSNGQYTCYTANGCSVVDYLINPRRACAARVTVVGFVCLSVCYSTSHLSNVCSSQKRSVAKLERFRHCTANA